MGDSIQQCSQGHVRISTAVRPPSGFLFGPVPPQNRTFTRAGTGLVIELLRLRARPCPRLREPGPTRCDPVFVTAERYPFKPHPHVEVRICAVIVLDHVTKCAVQQRCDAVLLRHAEGSKGAANRSANSSASFCVVNLSAYTHVDVQARYTRYGTLPLWIPSRNDGPLPPAERDANESVRELAPKLCLGGRKSLAVFLPELTMS